MRNKMILLTIALFIMLVDFSSCRMHVVQGTPYKVWKRSGNTRNHWGREKKLNNRHRYWGKHRSGMRPHKYRGHFRY